MLDEITVFEGGVLPHRWAFVAGLENNSPFLVGSEDRG